ncbi:hypothetical protein N7493_001182 [Penicillium malachiteum]|uniref:Uncharacterized protein n=1 Tax=Penicillium malachiteum TaxID=1324776 RepID=A0AAD6HU79_9EURO|nr:hypothetical protein N7493_001182 [Penicillium malachiteum]
MIDGAFQKYVEVYRNVSGDNSANVQTAFSIHMHGSAIAWEDWEDFVDEILTHHKGYDTHRRFHRAELRLARLNNVHRLTQFSPFETYLRDRRNFGSVFRDNITWLATTTAFLALVLTAMQVGLAADQLKNSKSFISASASFTVFAILGPLCAFGFIILDNPSPLKGTALAALRATKPSKQPSRRRAFWWSGLNRSS